MMVVRPPCRSRENGFILVGAKFVVFLIDFLKNDPRSIIFFWSNDRQYFSAPCGFFKKGFGSVVFLILKFLDFG
jgi:hypothetical protein